LTTSSPQPSCIAIAWSTARSSIRLNSELLIRPAASQLSQDRALLTASYLGAAAVADPPDGTAAGSGPAGPNPRQ
jgi:hypothetical protein